MGLEADRESRAASANGDASSRGSAVVSIHGLMDTVTVTAAVGPVGEPTPVAEWGCPVNGLPWHGNRVDGGSQRPQIILQ